MIWLIDITGILVIFALIYQGHIEALQFRLSLLIASLFSVVIFVSFFSAVYTFTMQFIPYSLISGLLVIILLNLFCILFFCQLFHGLIVLAKTRFLIPQFSIKIRKIGGMIIGACIGYIFVAGMITSFEEALIFRKKQHTNLVQSIFYKNHRQQISHEDFKKIDNLPALHMLYSQINVEKFQFSESELTAIMKMIREISNEEAKEILQQIQSKQEIGSIYLHLIEIYSKKINVSKKYFVSQEEILTLQTKIEKIIQIPTKKRKNISSIIDSI